MKKQLITRSIRFDKKALKEAARLGIDVSSLCREALDKALKVKALSHKA